MAEHFVRAPNWTWYILGYFFLAGLTGGLFSVGAMLRLWGRPGDQAAARVAFLWAFPIFLVCPILLTVDLGQPVRFWHMLVATTPGQGGLTFLPRSPMSVGSWALSLFGIAAFVSFLAALAPARAAAPASGAARWWYGAATLVALFFASYTGVLLSVSNQPVWSDTWTLGGLFLASGLSGGAALLAVCARSSDGATTARLHLADGYFALLELLWIVVLFASLGSAGALARVWQGPWIVLWLVVALGLIPPLAGLTGRVRANAGAGAGLAALLVLTGVLALRAVIIFSAQT